MLWNYVSNVITKGVLMESSTWFDLDRLIEKKGVLTFFQPIVSIKKKRVIGLEALSRGLDPDTGEVVSPLRLFAAAQQAGKVVELDRLCREKALENFADIPGQHDGLLLFINFNTSMIDLGISGSGNFMQAVRRNRINPSSIVIELVESRVRDFEALMKFIHSYRRHGFLFALDDFGAGYSNLERVSIIRPEIIKVDRSLIRDVHTEFYKQEVLKSIIKMGHQLGAMVLSEGVETYQEIIMTMEFDTDFVQGYYLSKPEYFGELPYESIYQRIYQVSSDFFECTVRKIKSRKEKMDTLNALSYSIMSSIRNRFDENVEDSLKKAISRHPEIECAYLIQETGLQASSTILNNGHCQEIKGGLFFRAAEKGDDHSLKEYFVHLQANLDKFITYPYISLATGNLCRTIAMKYKTKESQNMVLCLDIKECE